MLLSLLALAAAQTTPVQPIPKGTALAPQDADTSAVMVPVNALFAGIAARDAAAIAATELPDGGGAVAVIEGPQGATVAHMSWAELNAHFKPGPERYEERLYDPAIDVDGDVALVWGFYRFSVDGKLRHCGTDHFSLVRRAGVWKIASLTWSQRTTGCDRAG